MRINHRNTVNQHIEVWTKGNAGEVLSPLDQGIYQNLIHNYDSIIFVGFFQQLRIEGGDATDSKSVPLAELTYFLYQNPGARKAWNEIQRSHWEMRSSLLGDAHEIGSAYRSYIENGLKKLDEQST